MKLNFRSVVDLHKLSPSSPLLPLFESIVNSIQSIKEAGLDAKDGHIHVQVLRDISLFNMGGNVGWETDIESFEIIDNGTGFNQQNYDSFDVYGSDHKSDIGCKGVGRIIWLKAFSNIEIDSIYQQEGEFYKRKFKFSIAKERELLENEQIDEAPLKTRVFLEGFLQKYKSKCPKRLETLARDIMNHCFTYLALDDCPQITISDDNDSISINALFIDNIKGKPVIDDFIVKGHKFQLISAKNFAASDKKHLLHFCAHKREVNYSHLSGYIKELTDKLSDEDGDFVYAGYIIGDLLDENINTDRTEFVTLESDDTELSDDFQEETEEQLLLGNTNVSNTITKDAIIKATLPIIKKFLDKEIQQYRQEKIKRIEQYVAQENPKYRPLIRHNPECIDRIRVFSDNEKLELELFKQEQHFKLQLKKEHKNFVLEDINAIVDYKDYSEKQSAYLSKIADMGKSDLASYIVHRKTMLDIFSSNLQYTDEDKQRYALEKNIHNLIFPMKTTSDDIDYNKHNLWIIDEKLAYHYYLASDKSISSYNVIDSQSGKEPDIAIFEPAFALTDDGIDSEINNITIIEFKRPGRVDRECIDQVIGYVQDIREGRRKDKNGRVLAETTHATVKFSCYILCDTPNEMVQFLKGRNFRSTSDGKGYFQHFDELNTYIEVIPYGKMIRDSNKRNKILFDKLFS